MIVGAHSIIYSTNPEADRAFLRDVLGMPNVDVGGGWLIFGLPPAELAVRPGENEVHELYLMCDDVEGLIDAIKAGAQGYLLKNLEADDFFSMLDRASRGEPALTPNLARKLLQEFAKPLEVTTGDDAEELTVREREVLELMVEGVTSNRK